MRLDRSACSIVLLLINFITLAIVISWIQNVESSFSSSSLLPEGYSRTAFLHWIQVFVTATFSLYIIGDLVVRLSDWILSPICFPQISGVSAFNLSQLIWATFLCIGFTCVAGFFTYWIIYVDFILRCFPLNQSIIVTYLQLVFLFFTIIVYAFLSLAYLWTALGVFAWEAIKRYCCVKKQEDNISPFRDISGSSFSGDVHQRDSSTISRNETTEKFIL